MNTVFVWVSDFGNIDISEFRYLKFRKDGWFDGRRKDSYYAPVKAYIAQKEKELINACESAWNAAKVPNKKLN